MQGGPEFLPRRGCWIHQQIPIEIRQKKQTSHLHGFRVHNLIDAGMGTITASGNRRDKVLVTRARYCLLSECWPPATATIAAKS